MNKTDIEVGKEYAYCPPFGYAFQPKRQQRRRVGQYAETKRVRDTIKHTARVKVLDKNAEYSEKLSKHSSAQAVRNNGIEIEFIEPAFFSALEGSTLVLKDAKNLHMPWDEFDDITRAERLAMMREEREEKERTEAVEQLEQQARRVFVWTEDEFYFDYDDNDEGNKVAQFTVTEPAIRRLLKDITELGDNIKRIEARLIEQGEQ